MANLIVGGATVVPGKRKRIELDVATLLFEGGESLRYEERVIQTALQGILTVMESIGVIPASGGRRRRRAKEVFVARSSNWQHPLSRSLRARRGLGKLVRKGEQLGWHNKDLDIETGN